MSEFFKIFFDFRGRVNQKDFLITLVVYYGVVTLLALSIGDFESTILSFVKPVLSLLILSFRIRRIHDFGRSGWLLLLVLPGFFISSAAWIIADIILLSVKGSKEKNNFGAPMKDSYWLSLINVSRL